MKNQRNYVRHFHGLILALTCLIIADGLLLGKASQVFAQTTGPSWTFTGNLNTGRVFHTATLLPNGKVLVTGGQGGADSAELYDPGTGTWSFTGSLNTPRSFFHTATLLLNGKVLVAGGFNSDEINSAELYDPATGTWTLTGNLNVARHSHTATLLPDGKVLVAGGGDTDGGNTYSAELYDPATGMWSITGCLHTARGRHTATLLPDGRVLVAGGTDGFFPSLQSSELYDPRTGTWSDTGSLNTDRLLFTATLLRNGNLLVAGGESHQCGFGGCGFSTVTNSAELYNPATGTWSYTGNLSYRGYHTATLLANGQVLVAGGDSPGFITTNSAETYDPATGNWSSTASLNVDREFHTATLLSNGKVLVVGGRNRSILPSAELYDSGASSAPNPIDDAQFFVHQHYLDFLSREPEPQGFQDWMNVLNSCNGDSSCLYGPNGKRVLVSQSFFGSPEFNLKGGYVFRFYKASLARIPTYAEMVADMASVTGATADEVNQKRADFASNWVQRVDFLNAFPRSLTATEFVDNISQTAGITLSNRSQIISDLAANNTDAGRVTALRAIVDSQEEQNQEYNASFVYMQYVGYLRRDPEPAGYNDWLTYLNTHPGDFNTMVWGFVDSVEYRHRFGP